MNERIKELARESGEYVNEVYTPPVRSKTPGKIWEDGHVGWHTQFNQKFAELIVADVIAIIKDPRNYNEHVYTTFDLAQANDVAKQLATKIKEHFKDKL